MNILIYLLLLSNIFTNVDRCGKYDNHPFDYILKIRGDLQIIKAVADNLKRDNSDKDFSDSTDTAAEGYAAAP